MVYRIRYYDSVIVNLKEIKNYILEKSGSEELARKKVEDILYKISALEIFPEIGFDADEKYDKVLEPRYTTRGLVVGKDYLVLYFVDNKKEEVIITHLLPSKSDFIKLFK